MMELEVVVAVAFRRKLQVQVKLGIPTEETTDVVVGTGRSRPPQRNESDIGLYLDEYEMRMNQPV